MATAPAAADATLDGAQTAMSSGTGGLPPEPRDAAATLPADPWHQGQDPWARAMPSTRQGPTQRDATNAQYATTTSTAPVAATAPPVAPLQPVPPSPAPAHDWQRTDHLWADWSRNDGYWNGGYQPSGIWIPPNQVSYTPLRNTGPIYPVIPPVYGASE